MARSRFLIAKLDDDHDRHRAKKLSRGSIRSVSGAWRACTAGARTSLRPRQTWAGVGLVRSSSGTALVGNPDEVAGTDEGIYGSRHQSFVLRLSASRGMLSLRRARISEASLKATTGNDLGPAKRQGEFGEVMARVAFALPAKGGGGLTKDRAPCKIAWTRSRCDCVARQSPGAVSPPARPVASISATAGVDRTREHGARSFRWAVPGRTCSGYRSSLAAILPIEHFAMQHERRSTIRSCLCRPSPPRPSISVLGHGHAFLQ